MEDMKNMTKMLTEYDKQSIVRYFKVLLRVLKRLKKEAKANPSILDNLEPGFCLLLEKYNPKIGFSYE